MANEVSAVRFNKLVGDVAGKLDEISDTALNVVRHVAVLRRDIGEMIIRAFSPKAAVDRRSFNELAPETRDDYRRAVEDNSRDEMARLSEALIASGTVRESMSPTLLYDCVKLAAAFTAAEITSWIDSGLSMTNLLQTSGFTDHGDRVRALQTAVDSGRTTVEAFSGVVEEIEAESALGMRPAVKAARKAAETKKNNKKRAKAGPPPDAISLVDALEKFRHDLDDRHLVAVNTIWARMENEYAGLDLASSDKVQEIMAELKLPLEALRQAVDLLLGFVGKKKDKEDGATAVATKRKRK